MEWSASSLYTIQKYEYCGAQMVPGTTEEEKQTCVVSNEMARVFHGTRRPKRQNLYFVFVILHSVRYNKNKTPEKPVISGLPGLSVTNALLFSVL